MSLLKQKIQSSADWYISWLWNSGFWRPVRRQLTLSDFHPEFTSEAPKAVDDEDAVNHDAFYSSREASTSRMRRLAVLEAVWNSVTGQYDWACECKFSWNQGEHKMPTLLSFPYESFMLERGSVGLSETAFGFPRDRVHFDHETGIYFCKDQNGGQAYAVLVVEEYVRDFLMQYTKNIHHIICDQDHQLVASRACVVCRKDLL